MTSSVEEASLGIHRRFAYTDNESVGTLARVDHEISIANCVVGRNRPGGKPNDLAWVYHTENGYRYFSIGVILEQIAEPHLWATRGGKSWKFVFKVVWIKTLVPIHVKSNLHIHRDWNPGHDEAFSRIPGGIGYSQMLPTILTHLSNESFPHQGPLGLEQEETPV